MVASKNVVCPSCGFKQNPPGSKRCLSCGAPIDEGDVGKRAVEEGANRYQQEGVNLPWMAIALVVQGLLTAALIFGLPLVITKLDFEGGNGMLMCIPVWFAGGVLVGMISPGRTFIEPVIAALLVAIPTTILLVNRQTVRTMPTFLYCILAAIGVLFTLVGAYVGERIQLGPPPKTAE